MYNLVSLDVYTFAGTLITWLRWCLRFFPPQSYYLTFAINILGKELCNSVNPLPPPPVSKFCPTFFFLASMIFVLMCCLPNGIFKKISTIPYLFIYWNSGLTKEERSLIHLYPPFLEAPDTVLANGKMLDN